MTTFSYPAPGGAVFKITLTGALTTVYSFCAQSNCTDGSNPFGALIEASDGNFYGTTYRGGAAGNGTVFKMTPAGSLTTLYSFCSQSDCADGAEPVTSLIQATDGNFYATTWGGANQNWYEGCGTVFKITPTGTLTTLHSFRKADGGNVEAALFQATNGNLYGASTAGGAFGDYGNVFVLSMGFAPFVETEPVVGRVGQKVRVLGNYLTGATSVTFNGTPAVFKVVSYSLIAATVPAGATTGTVQVTTPSGVLSSNVPFRVVQ